MTTKEFKGEWEACKDNGLEDLFLKECESICHDREKFLSFKRNLIFTKVIGNDIRPKHISDVWYKFIENTEIMKDIRKYKTNDIFGHPVFYYYPKTGIISPGTLYFLAITHDINTRLINIKDKKICEIGSGYGGQSKIFLDYGCKTVDLIDRKQTLGLANKYLKIFKYENVSFHPTTNVPDKEYDLVVSNWCISELDKEGTLFYLNNVVKKSQYGYFLINYTNEDKKDWFVKELKKIFSDVKIERENPKTNENTNYAILCKK